MADTVKIGGQHYPKMAVYGGVGVVLIAAVMYYRNKQSQAATAAANQAAVTQAGSSEIDPATGYPYGSAEDAAALSSQSSYQYADTSSQYGYYGDGVSGTGLTDYPYTTNEPGAFTSNAQWAQYVEQYLENNMGADPTTVGNAVGKYITGQPLTTDTMISIIQSAIAIGGYPPVAGTNGNPPGYATSPTTPATPTPTPTSTNGYHTPGSISNLQGKVSGTTGVFTWNPPTGATSQGYAYALTEMNGVVVQKGNTTATTMSFPNLHKGWTYNFGIQALPGGEGDNVHITV